MEMHEGYQRVAHRAVFVRSPSWAAAKTAWSGPPRLDAHSNVAVAVNHALTYLRIRHRNEVYYLAKGTFTTQRLEEEFRKKEWAREYPSLIH